MKFLSIQKNIIYINFEKSSTLLKIPNGNELINFINSLKKEDGKYYIFIDEIQELKDRTIAIKDLRLDNNSIFITGSNSKLLSSEILNKWSGRFVDFRIRPFVYKEIKEYLSELNNEPSINDYLIWGGFPARFLLDDVSNQKEYLTDLQETIVYNDLIRRYKIRKKFFLKRLLILFYLQIQE